MTIEAPRAPKIKLGQLAQGYLGDIDPEEFLEGMEFSGLDLAEVDSTQATYLDCSLSRLNFGCRRVAREPHRCTILRQQDRGLPSRYLDDAAGKSHPHRDLGHTDRCRRGS